MAQSDLNPSAERGDLLRLPLFPRNTRGEGAYWAGDRLFDADPDFHAAQFGCDRLDRSKFLSLPRSRAGSDFSAGAKTWTGRAWRSPHFLADERKARNGS